MTPEEVVLLAVTWATANNIRLVRGPIFSFCEEPPACGALGAVLLKAGLARLCEDGFDPGWDEKLRGLLEADRTWVWRFNHGWNHGNCLTVEYEEKGKTKILKDEVSHWAHKLAKTWAKR